MCATPEFIRSSAVPRTLVDKIITGHTSVSEKFLVQMTMVKQMNCLENCMLLKFDKIMCYKFDPVFQIKAGLFM